MPPHPATTDLVLDCVPALAASVMEAVQEQVVQGPHWQFLGALPVQGRESSVFGGQSVHVLVCMPDAPHVFGEQVLHGSHTHGGPAQLLLLGEVAQVPLLLQA